MKKKTRTIVAEVKELRDEFIAKYDELKIGTLLWTESMTKKTQSLHFMQARAERKHVTGLVCFSECIPDGRRKKALRLKHLDYLEGDEAGIKSVTIPGNTAKTLTVILKAKKAYTDLFVYHLSILPDRRHTSFASCDVMPEIDDDVNNRSKA